MLQTLSDVARAYDEGRSWQGYLRRNGPPSVAGYWQDLMYAGGYPGANYYVGTAKTSTLLGLYDGILSGPDVEAEGYKKYLHKVLIVPPSTSIGQFTVNLHDIVMFYPFVDGDGGEQPLTTNVTNRYGGANCHMMMVSQGVGIATTTATVVVYEDAAGVTQTTTVQTKHDVTGGALLTVADAVAAGGTGIDSPYITCPTGCKRIISIDPGAAVSGIFSAVIVKPLATISVQTVATPVEVDFLRDRLRAIEIDDGCYLSAVYRATASATPNNFMAEFSFIWS